MYNPKSPGVKRLMKEAKELAEPTEEYFACPLDDNIFEWHFTVRGPPGTEFEGGYYHGRILLPTQYPMKPPNIILLTPNGRFEVNKKICLSISEHHPETWQPSWSIRTALLALIAFMPTAAAGTIGSLDYTADERRTLARRSRVWECCVCGVGRVASRLLAAAVTGDCPASGGADAADKVEGGGGQMGGVLTEEETRMIQKIALKVEDDSTSNAISSSDVKPGSVAVGNATSDNNLTRRCAVQENSNTSIVTEASVQDSLLNVSVASSNRDQLWSAVIWILVLSISLLVMRRLFFL